MAMQGNAEVRVAHAVSPLPLTTEKVLGLAFHVS